MNASRDSREINHPRRRLIGAAAMTVAAAQFGMGGSAEAQIGATKPHLPAIKPGTNTTFAPLKQIDAGLLNVGYAEAGPADGPVVLLLHGWPYDIYSFVDVAPLLASAGYRVIVPYLRGYGTTRFLAGDTMRNGQQSAVALDAIALMDALKIDKATLAGFDWGARTADIVAALWPERCKALWAFVRSVGCARRSISIWPIAGFVDWGSMAMSQIIRRFLRTATVVSARAICCASCSRRWWPVA